MCIIRNIKVGALCSGGGSSLISAYDIFNTVYDGSIDLVIAADRDCGIKVHAEKRRIKYKEFANKDNAALSKNIANYFKKEGEIDFVLLYFLKIVTSDLFNAFPTLNIHPSLLPAFSGFDALEKALKSNSTFIGATVHVADDRIDGGEIVAQVSHQIPSSLTLKEAKRLSYAQKVYLSILIFELHASGKMRFSKTDENNYTCSIQTEFKANDFYNLKLVNEDLKAAFNSFLHEHNLEKYSLIY